MADPDYFSDAISAVVLVATIATAAVAGAALRSQRTAFLTEARAQWEALHPAFGTAVLLFDQTTTYYASAVMGERARVAALIARVNDPKTSLTEQIDILRSETPKVRSVARYLAYLAEGILRGRISPRDAYTLLGPDVARHWRMLYWVAGRDLVRTPAMPPDSSNWEQSIDQVVEWNFHGEQAAIVFLADLLVAESSHRGDTYPHLVIQHARRTSDRAFRQMQRRDLGDLTRTLGARRRRLRLARHLRWARRPPFHSVVRSQEPVRAVTANDLNLLRWSRVLKPLYRLRWYLKTRV